MDTLACSSFSVSPQELNVLIGTPAAPTLLDVRPQHRFANATHILAGAKRCPAEELEQFALNLPTGEIIVYCVHGHQVSQGAAELLREAGWNARYLAGGIEGGEPNVDQTEDINHWRATRLLTIKKRPDLGVTGERPSRFITRERPKIDRIACPWLVRRFIDRQAEFIYVPTEMVLSEAAKRDAVAYDLPGAPITHDGDLCSFDSLLAAFQLQEDPALSTLAQIVRGADTDRLSLAPQAAGLLAFSLGLSSLNPKDDLAMLEAAMPLYDALYAWCRTQVEGQRESHSWKPELMAGAQA